MLTKLDLQKAYDSIEWSFVEEMLRALKFPQHMITLLMNCITTPSFSIALNGEVFGFFPGKRGLRQGDSLSPLIFTLCLEYLSRTLMVTQRHPKFRFHLLCKRIELSNLCFADDLILFCKGERASIELLL
ncbi:secreted RxLR effector protein 78-like [Silene latifolia]|uniref:secreted RxLR effector protein 78-like n=1 Tax=Silene latifolia TaxID=37657 RepID=UPI003D77D8FF